MNKQKFLYEKLNNIIFSYKEIDFLQFELSGYTFVFNHSTDIEWFCFLKFFNNDKKYWDYHLIDSTDKMEEINPKGYYVIILPLKDIDAFDMTQINDCLLHYYIRKKE